MDRWIETLKIFFDWLDDKSQVIAALLIIALVIVFWSEKVTEPVGETIRMIISGLLGVAIGRAIPRRNGTSNDPA